MGNIPKIQKLNGIDTLFVQGEPFLALAGEIHNSSSSNLEYMEKNIWPNLQDLDMNTVILPIYWEQMEEQEGRYNFEILDGIIKQARNNHMHLILLWFGLWKNAASTYIPGWMKTDPKTYYRAKKVNGETLNTISPLCEAAVEKDARAIAKVMAHIREIDEKESTVIMIQIENEIGLLGTDRDYSEVANKNFEKAVPTIIAEKFEVTGTWKEAFGDEAGEYFIAYHFATAIEQISLAAQKEYPIPCFANAWLKQYPWYAGSYPSGGPVKSMHPMYKLVAPSLACLAPDIYVPYVPQIMDEYNYEGNPLVIPEVRKDAITASYAMYAFGKCNAICYSPFGIEDLSMTPETIDMPPMGILMELNIDPSAFDIRGSKVYLAKTYSLIKNIKPLYLEYRGTDHLQSFVKQTDHDYGAYLQFEKYDMQIRYSPKEQSKPVAAGMIFEISENCFFVIGMMFSITVRPKPGLNAVVDFVKLEEGDFQNGEWKVGRVLNGDEKMMLKLNDMPGCYYVEVFQY